jgi:hypothetical protein
MAKTNTSTREISIFISYAHEDQELCELLITHLSSLKSQGLISHWYDGQISAGQRWEDAILTQLTSAQLVLLLVSPDFIASKFINDVELTNSMRRDEASETCVIPIILRPCDWEHTVFGELQALPTNAKPITTWQDQDSAFLNVVQSLREAIEKLSVSPLPGPEKQGRARVEQRLTVSKPGILRHLMDRYLPSLHRFLSKLGTLSKPPETDTLNDYLRHARANIENDIRQKTYIPLAGKEVSSTSLQGGPGMDPFVPPIQRAIRQVVGRSAGGDSASAQIAAVNRSSRVIRNILKTLLNSTDPLVLLGDPGTGKTMTLQQTAMVLFDSEIRRVFPIVTLYVRLGEFYVEGRVTPEDVWRYVKASVSPQISPYLDELDKTDRLIILFDGLDEMSRERYGEHTEALSIFAASRKGRTKTLFSCRITDFSPKFMHRRLVLLPFSDEQIGEYLRRYIPSFPLTIEGKTWTQRSLVKHLLRGSLPMEATNPFVLWLLCFQLQKIGSWPASRVDLLRFYIEENYRRKSEEQQEEHAIDFPPMDQALAGWATFAYTITNLNRGAAIAVSTLIENVSDGLNVEELIGIGKRCGVLQESTSEEARQVRFEHHRFQEFFTALFLYQRQPAIVWLDKLDAPRWQETMVNLILMGGGQDAVQTLTDAIQGEIEAPLNTIALARANRRPTYAIDPYDPYDEDSNLDPKREPRIIPESEEDRLWWEERLAREVAEAFSPERETFVADRIELASRIVRQSASSSTTVSATLTPTLQKAVGFLSEYGNPITQVKMMRACQNVPAVDIFQVLQSTLKSPINWVRNQALVIVSGSNRGPLEVGSHFATRLGYDLANGLLPFQLKAYGKAAIAAGRVRNWWCLAVGTLCYLLNLSLLIGIALPLYFFAWILLTGPSPLLSFPLDERIYVAACALITTAAIGIAIKRNPGRIWIAILASSAGTFGVTLIILAASKGGLGFVLMLTFSLVMVGSLITALIGVPVALGIHFLALAVYLGTTAPVRHSVSSLRSYFAATWRGCAFREVFLETGKYGGKSILFCLLGSSPFLLYYGGSWLSRVSHLPFSAPINLLLIVCSVTLVTAGFVGLIRREVGAIPRYAGYILIGVGGLTLVVGAMYAVRLLLHFAVGLLDRLTLPLGMLLVKIVASLIVLGVIGGLVYTLWLFRRSLQVIIVRIRNPATSSPIAPGRWKRQLARADAGLQQILLSQTNHQTLGLKADEFLLVLEDVKNSISEEPALSTYWEKRDRLEQVLRQEREG